VPVAEVGPALAQQHGGEQRRRDADGHVDEEDPRPAQVAGEDAAEQYAGRGAAAGRCAVDPQRHVAVATLGEGRHQQREGGGSEQGAAEPLNRPEGDQRGLRPGDGAQERARGEEEQARDEQPPPAEEIGEAASEQQRAAEEDRVRRDDPMQARLREPQIGFDRRERDVDDRDVEDDHELRRYDQRQRTPPSGLIRSSRQQLTS
jgi:hypothetical protein